VPAKNFQVRVGEIPEGFEQLVPTGQMKFVPVPGERYSLRMEKIPDYTAWEFATDWTAD